MTDNGEKGRTDRAMAMPAERQRWAEGLSLLDCADRASALVRRTSASPVPYAAARTWKM